MNSGQPNIGLIVALIILAILVIGSVFLLLKYFYDKKHFDEHYYRKIYRVAVVNDYYLINHFIHTIDDSTKLKVDHILFGDKFIYVISCKFFDGDIDGKGNDNSFIFVNRNGKTCYTPNLIEESKKLATNVSMISGINPDFIIGITMVNDDCKVGVTSNSKQFYIIQRNRFSRLVRAIESRSLGNLNARKLKQAVEVLDTLNERHNAEKSN